jgi:hypothetical protein
MVTMAVIDNLGAALDAVDAVGSGHGELRDLLHLLGQLRERGFGDMLRDQRARSLVETDLHVPAVDVAVLLDVLHHGEGFLHGVATGHEVLHGDADDDGHVLADVLAAFVHDVDQELAALLVSAAPTVSTTVRELRDEAGDLVADAGMDLDHVAAPVLRALRGGAVLLDHGLDLFGLQLAELLHERAARTVGRADSLQGIVLAGTPLVADVQLRSNLRAPLVAAGDQLFPAFFEVIAPHAGSTRAVVVLRLRVVQVCHVARADLDQADTALGALLIEVDDGLGQMVVLGEFRIHRSHDEAVFHLDVADFYRLVDAWKACQNNPFR